VAGGGAESAVFSRLALELEELEELEEAGCLPWSLLLGAVRLGGIAHCSRRVDQTLQAVCL
jgi:hypothetical protein